MSSQQSRCPFCGAAVEGAAPSVPVAQAETTVNEQNAAPQRTLNDILAERQAQAQRTTINDTHAAEPKAEVVADVVAESKAEVVADVVAAPKPEVKEEVKEEAKPVVTPIPSIEPTSAPEPKSHYDGDYDREERMMDDYEADITRYKRSSAGFLVLAAILFIVLIPLTIFAVKNYGKVKAIEQDYALLQSARSLFEEQNSMLQRDAESLVKELETYKGKNDTMMQRYQEAVVMLEQLQKEKTYSYNQLAKYRKEVDMLKGVMKGYIRKIDSLNDINTNLKAKNVEYEKERKSFKERAEKAEEKADELSTKVRIGSVIRTGGVRIVALNDNSKPVKRIKVASRLRVDFELTANELAEPGEKTVYVCITNPEGYVLSPASKMIPFTFEGESRAASAVRKVSYENQSVPVSVFYDGEAFEKGTYTVDIYVDGRHCGSGSAYFE